MLVDGRSHGIDLLAHLEPLASEIVAKAALESLRQPLGRLEPEDQRMEIDRRLSPGDDGDRRQCRDLDDTDSGLDHLISDLGSSRMSSV